MAPHARNPRISRRSWLLAGFTLPVCRAVAAPSLSLSYDGDNVLVTAPELNFLAGKPLQRLKEGATVGFLSRLTIYSDSFTTVFRQAAERMVLSYALWEERYSVTIPGRRAQANLTLEQAEAWCMENMAISALGMASDRPFWLKFELRSATPRELSRVVGDTGISIIPLIEIFSRKPGGEGTSWTRSAGPIRLADLPRIPGRGRTG